MADKIELLNKLRKLALQGVGGEKENAQELLDKLIQKYNVSISDLDEETIKEFTLEYHGNWEKNLLVQIAYKVTDVTGNLFRTRYTHSGRLCKTKLHIQCTDTQKIEIEFLFDFYKKLWEKEQKVFFSAFIQKHELYGNLKKGEKPIERSLEEIAKIALMQQGMSDETPMLQIEEVKE